MDGNIHGSKRSHNPESVGELHCRHVSNGRRLRTVSTPPASAVVMLLLIAFVAIMGVYAIIIFFESTYGVSSIEVKSVRLAMVGDDKTSDTVHGNIIFTVDKRANLLLTGDVWEVELLWSDSRIDPIAVKDGVSIISYDGLLILNEPASAGDEVEIVIRNGGSETSVTATLGAAT